MTASGSVSTGSRPRTRPSVISSAMLFFAVGQLIAPIFTARFGGSFTSANRAGEPPLTPAGYTFSIWLVIELVSVALAIFLVRHRRRTDADLIDRIAAPLLVVFAGFSAWLVAAEVEPVWSTLVVIVVMFVALLAALRIALGERRRIAAWSGFGRVVLWWTLGLYAGWISVAMWLNLTTAFAGAGAPVTGTVAISAQIATLAGALGTAVILLVWTGGLIPYALAVCWGLVGAIVGTVEAGEPALTTAAAIGLAIVVAVTAVSRRRVVTSGGDSSRQGV